jgi:hypothetical protein
MKWRDNYFLLFIVVLFISTIFKLSFVDKLHIEPDDMIAMHYLVAYEDQSIYKIVNDKNSPSYNSKIKKKIREIESKDSVIYNFIENKSSKVLNSAAPSKNSTLAPMQYLIFGKLVSKTQNYNQLKFYSRIPSIFYTILYILMTYYFCSFLFPTESRFSFFSVLMIILSFPLIYISLRSYTYAAGIFATTIIFFLTYLEMIGKNFSKIKLTDKKINIKNSIYLAIIFSLLAYTNFCVFYILPLFFLICFIQNFKIKKLFSFINYNLFLVGIFFIIFSSPLILHIYNLSLHDYAVKESPGGFGMVYHLSEEEKMDKVFVILFFLKNAYLTISKNLSFFVDNFYMSKFIQSILFIFVILGLFISRKENNNLKMFSNLSIVFFSYYFTLVYLGILTLGPTRHTNFYTPLFAILFVITLRFTFSFISQKYNKMIFNILIISTLIIFFNSLQIFYNKYTDNFNEDEMVSLVKKYNVDYISTGEGFANEVCYMKNIKIKIRTCPKKYNRHNNVFLDLDKINLKEIKEEKKSIMFLNDRENLIKYQNILSENNFKLIKEINKTKFDYHNSPLFISEKKPNRFELFIYR